MNVVSRSESSYKYKAWMYVYKVYLEELYKILNTYKVCRLIDKDKFFAFVFEKSSQYISPYAK